MPANIEHQLRPAPHIIDFPQTDGPTRPAPRLPATRGSLTDLASRRPALRSRLEYRARQLLVAIEPWYNWGETFIERMEAKGEGPGYFVSLQWLGISLTIFFGRTPKAVLS